MDLQPPLLQFGEQEDDGELSLEEAFADILQKLMKDEFDAASAIQAFEKASTRMMQQYKEASSALLHRAAHYLHTRRLAADLESQAASWQLLQALYCSGDNPAGILAGAADAGGQQTLRQRTADLVNTDVTLRRVAQVVCWLESLAAQQLQQASTARFAHHEGLWRETLLTTGSVGSRATACTDVELDPDAPGRGKVTLATGDRKGEERLASQLWQLIRAGKVREGRQLCCQAGQAWRCLSLGGGGEWGPLPVGDAATEAAEQIDQQAAADELACQIESGLASGRLAWKWACYAAAEAAANATPGNRWEAAVYGALCGHVAAMLPVCADWTDELWSYCRAWLDSQADSMLLEDVGMGVPEAVQEMLGEDDMVDADLLTRCVSQAAASGYSNSTDTSLLSAGLSVMMRGAWPLPTMLKFPDGRPLIPLNFTELKQRLDDSNNPTVQAGNKQQQHILQLLVMSEDWKNIAMELAATALAAAEQLQQQQDAAGDADEQMGYEGAADEGAHLSAESAAGTLRFAAHLALCLRALGLVHDHTWAANDEEEADLARLQTILGRVVYQYAMQLAQQPDTLALVPLYLCHLRPGLRESLLEALLENATDHLDDMQCQSIYGQLLSLTEQWRLRQDRVHDLVLVHGVMPGPLWVADDAVGDDGDEYDAIDRVRKPSSCLVGDLRPEELRLLLQHLITRGCASSSTSPLERCRQLRWLFYSFTGALTLQQNAEAAADDTTDLGTAPAATSPTAAAALTAGGELAWQGIWADALEYALNIATEMVLNAGFSSLGLQTLFGEVVPLEFFEVAGKVAAEQLLDPVQQLQVQRQLHALYFWHQYVGLDARYQQWKQDWRAALSADAASELLNDAAEQGQQLAWEMLALASRDMLRLPAADELVQIIAATAAQQGDDYAAGVVGEGELLALPLFDDSNERLTELVLAVTVARAPGQGRDEPDMKFIQMEARETEALLQQVNHFLAKATSATPDINFATDLPDPSSDLAGTVQVKLTSFNGTVDPSAPAEEKARLGRRMTSSWQDMVAVAADLLGSQAGGAAAGPGAAEVQLPQLALVHIDGSCSTRLALCRRKTASKLLRRSGKVLLELARAGHPSSQLDVLISAAGDAAGAEGPALLELLSPADAGKLLVVLEQAIEEGGLIEEGDADLEL